MGYRIEYGPEYRRFRKESPAKGKILPLTAAFLVLFLALTAKFWPEGKETLENILLPGDPQVTKQAFSQMAQDLKEGEAIGDAVITFCREITGGAALSD